MLKERIEKLFESNFAKHLSTKNLSDETKHEIEAIWHELKGYPLHSIGGCINCYAIGLWDIKQFYQLNKTEIMENKKRQFSLEKGTMIQNIDLHHPITNDNCTDENAFHLLSINKKNIGQFATFPDDWEKQLEKYKKNPDAFKLEETTETNQDQDEEGTEASALEERHSALNAQNKQQLQEFCVSQEFPEGEWEKLNKTKLVDYLLEKTA